MHPEIFAHHSTEDCTREKQTNLHAVPRELEDSLQKESR